MSTQNTNTLASIVAQVTTAKESIKLAAIAARDAAPKGAKMAHGQHASATQSAVVAEATMGAMQAHGGFTLAAASAKVSKTGRTEFVFTYRQAQTLEQRVATVANSAERRKLAREAAKAAKDAKVTAIPAAKPTNAMSALANLAKAA